MVPTAVSGAGAGTSDGLRGVLQPSLLMLHLRQIKGPGSGSGSAGRVVQPTQAVRLRMQRPTLVVDVAFIMQLLNFVAPMPVLQVCFDWLVG